MRRRRMSHTTMLSSESSVSALGITRVSRTEGQQGRLTNSGYLIKIISSFEQCFILFCSFPLLFAFVVGGLGFEFCVFVAGWRHALRSEWPIIIIINEGLTGPQGFPPGVASKDTK